MDEYTGTLKDINVWLEEDCRNKDAIIIFKHESEIFLRNLRSGEVYFARSERFPEGKVVQGDQIRYSLKKKDAEGQEGIESVG